MVACPGHSECYGLPPRELPKRMCPKVESEAGEEESPDKWASVSKQEKQLLIDCLSAIIR